MQYGRYGSGQMPEVVKNLLIINGLVFLLTFLYPEWTHRLGLYYFSSEKFQPYQIITHMFTHGGTFHLLFNMFALWMFGSALERIWGPKRFLAFYLITGLGAMFLHQAVNALQVYQETGSIVLEKYDLISRKLQMIYHIPMVGASGAIYGLLVGFGVLFPNTQLMLLFPPIPIKAKYFIPILIAVEFFMGARMGQMSNIAHFAHLGGALFGFLLVKYWNVRSDRFY